MHCYYLKLSSDIRQKIRPIKQYPVSAIMSTLKVKMMKSQKEHELRSTGTKHKAL